MSKGSIRYRTTAEMPEGMRQLAEQQLQSATARTSGAPTPMRQLRRDEIADAKPFQVLRHVKHTAGVMNKTEARFAQQLEAEKAGGDIVWFAFEAVKFRLAKNTWLTIDFLVKHANGEFIAIDVKGRKGDRYWAEEDAKIKLKVAAETFPLKFVVTWPKKGGGWCSEVIG